MLLLLACTACSQASTNQPSHPSTNAPPAGSSGSAGTAVSADPPHPVPDASVASAKDAQSAEPAASDSGSSIRDPDAAAVAAPDAGSTPLARYATRKLDSPPTYLGSVDNGADCSHSYPTLGFEPVAVAGERFPLFLYFVGTAFVQPDASASPDGQAALAVSEAMARRGFVALSVGYDNGAIAWLSDHQNQLACLFGGAEQSLLAVACALPQVDCDLGIATWGHSQGAFVGVAAARFEPRVRAAWTTGYGGDASSTLSPNRLRVVNGEADTNNGTPEVLNMITGLTAGDCAAGASECLRADGSGWIIVRKSELADPDSSSADHCWFDKRACLDSATVLEPTWVDRMSMKAYALEINADWVASTALR